MLDDYQGSGFCLGHIHTGMYDGHDIGLFSGIFVFKEEIEKESPSFVRPELYEKALDFILKQNNEYKETYTHKFVHDRPDETHVENLRYNDPYSHEC